MGYGLWSWVVRVRVTVVYAVLLIAVSTSLLWLGPDVEDRVIRHASTNLHNLSHGHLGTLVASAFVVDARPVYLWLPGLVCLLALGEFMWGSGRLVVAFAVGHVGATLLVAAGLTTAVELGWLPGAVTRAADVGMSYGATAVLGALTAAIPVRWRPVWIGWWVGLGIAVVAIGRDFTDAGHATALVLGMVVATRFGRAQSWTPVRLALLVVAVAFGNLILVSGDASVVVGLLGAIIGAAVVAWEARRPSNRHEPSVARPSGGGPAG